MFDIGFFELLLIGIVGLLVLGPERLPKAARTAGLWIGRVKRSVSTMQREITSQLEAEELRQKLAEQQKKLDEGVNQARRSVEQSVESPPKKESRPSSPSSGGSARIDAPDGSKNTIGDENAVGDKQWARETPDDADQPSTSDASASPTSSPSPDKDSATR